MDEQEWPAEQFEAHRNHLRAVAYRMLGSLSEADDAVQESWLRLSRSDTSGIENMGGWLTTVVGRVCLDMLRLRKSRREEPLEPYVPEPDTSRSGIDPEREALLADSVGVALLVVLDTLNPAERVAFVLHDIFAVPFAEIGTIIERSPTAVRQLASRARRRVHGAATVPNADLTRQRKLVDAFLAASRAGDFDALLSMLDPDVVLRADRTAVSTGTPVELRGATAVAKHVNGRAQFTQSALVNGAVGIVVAPFGRLSMVIGATVRQGKVVEFDLIADPERLRQFDLAVLHD